LSPSCLLLFLPLLLLLLLLLPTGLLVVMWPVDVICAMQHVV
jgi:hypothetical protein